MVEFIVLCFIDVFNTRLLFCDELEQLEGRQQIYEKKSFHHTKKNMVLKAQLTNQSVNYINNVRNL